TFPPGNGGNGGNALLIGNGGNGGHATAIGSTPGTGGLRGLLFGQNGANG
ncbi:PE-PGRS family protein, partial [Mycobacterium persicum]